MSDRSSIINTGGKMKVKTKDEVKQFYADQCKGAVGAKLITARPMTNSEIEALGWDEYDSEGAIVLIFDNGHVLIPARDPELNGAGFIEPAEMKKG
jgi:hypothetical protein